MKLYCIKNIQIYNSTYEKGKIYDVGSYYNELYKVYHKIHDIYYYFNKNDS